MSCQSADPAQNNWATNMEPQVFQKPPTWEETEKMLAEAMAKLSVAERNSTMEDLHGIRGDDSSSSVASSASCTSHASIFNEQLEEMHQWMEAHPNQAYQIAVEKEFQGSHYVSDPEFRTYFLKSADSGEAIDGAKRMLAYLDLKLNLFGEDALCRPITMKDLSHDDIEVLKEGFFQDLGQDSTGRQLIGCFPSQNMYKTVDSFVSCSST